MARGLGGRKPRARDWQSRVVTASLSSKNAARAGLVPAIRGEWKNCEASLDRLATDFESRRPLQS